MKKLLYLSLLASALLAAGCAKEAAPSYQGDGSKKITVTANTETPVSSKATVSDEGVISWSEGDQIGVWDEGQSKQLQFSYVKGSSKSFEGSVAESSNLTFAVAPYNEGNDFLTENTTVTATVVLPNSYSDYIPGTETTSGTTNAPMLAKGKTLEGDNYTFDFKHTAALVKVTYENVPVGTASFELYADQVIAGTYDLDFDLSKDEEEPILKNASGTTSKPVTFYLKEAVTELNQTLSFYVPVPAGQYTYFRTILYDAGANMISGTGRQLTLPSNEQTFTRAEMLILPTIKLAEAKAGSKYSWTLASNDVSSSGTQVSKGTPELSWTPEYSDGTIGNLNKDKGLQVGSSNKPCTSLSLTTSGYTDYIENVIVNFSTANDGTAKVSVKVGGKDLYYGSATQADGTTSATSYAFKASELLSGDVVITFTNTAKAFYIKSIEINGDSRTAQSLSFSSTTASAVLDEDFTEPTLSGEQTTVTYTSSNTDVATVDASTGEVTLVAAGTTTITATAEATSDYQEGSASYELTVSSAYQFSTIAELIEKVATKGTYIGKLINAVVTYVSGDYAFLEDETAAIMLYKVTGRTSGESISGEVTVTGTVYNNVPEVTALTVSNAEINLGATLPLTTVDISTLTGSYSTYLSRRVKIKGVTVSTAFNKSSSSNVTGAVSDGTNTYAVRTLGSSEITKGTVGNVIDLIGVPTSYTNSKAGTTTQQLYVLSDDDITVTTYAPTLSVSPTSLSWESTAYGSGNAKTIAVTLNGNASGYTVSGSSEDWTVSDDGAGTVTVYPNAENTSTTDAKTLTLTIAHKDDGSLTETVTCTQNYSGAATETKTYRHIFTAKPSIGTTTLSNVSWSIEATNLGSYNSSNYAGVQLGSKKNSGSITLTSSSDWSFEGASKITEIRVWMNAGTGTPTATVTIGGKAATSDGTTVVKNSSAESYSDATKVTYTPASDGDTGIVVINVSTASKAGYICAIEIDCQ